ncbi:MAG: hypothetical protein LBF81_06315 [Prevotellaceae bacterium]|nr:hypothetical protein [Prevotellaceae bacterium]
MQGGISYTSRGAEAFCYAPALLRAKGWGARFSYQHPAPNGADARHCEGEARSNDDATI